MSLIYVFTAMTMEGQAIRKISGPNKLVPINSGMGPKNAKREAEVALGVSDGTPMREKPDAVVVIGLCGGLTSSLPEGRIVAYTECRSSRKATVTPHHRRILTYLTCLVALAIGVIGGGHG